MTNNFQLMFLKLVQFVYFLYRNPLKGFELVALSLLFAALIVSIFRSRSHMIHPETGHEKRRLH